MHDQTSTREMAPKYDCLMTITTFMKAMVLNSLGSSCSGSLLSIEMPCPCHHGWGSTGSNPTGWLLKTKRSRRAQLGTCTEYWILVVRVRSPKRDSHFRSDISYIRERAKILRGNGNGKCDPRTCNQDEIGGTTNLVENNGQRISHSAGHSSSVESTLFTKKDIRKF